MKILLIICMIAATTGSYAQVKKEAVKSTICKGTAKTGKPCKRKTRDISGYCFSHKPKSK